ncbi:hypothetical protein NDU88_001628 [Pleurodeles waltl]|uniref:Uncharacterized protein n=1 Tax=Pleurodeles waltl TaxID=8319 RepID=A0AAV7U852_PLEWA|nr:hypothetical protein NDU88_001628 [Pleurodeles waltl]
MPEGLRYRWLQLRGQVADVADRYALLHANLDGHECCILNMYAPNTDDEKLFRVLEQELLPYVGMPILWACDFICIVDGALVRCPPRWGTKPRMTARLQEMMTRMHFVDFWRELIPVSKTYSFYTPAHGAYSMLDRILLANDGSLTVRRAAYQVRFLSDYAPLVLECETCPPRPAVPL